MKWIVFPCPNYDTDSVNIGGKRGLSWKLGRRQLGDFKRIIILQKFFSVVAFREYV